MLITIKQQNRKNETLDCLVIGGGPAGLTAAVYLARFRRNFCLVDSNASRAALIPTSHNCLGYTEGIAGNELLKRMRQHAEIYGANIISDSVTQLNLADNKTFYACTKDKNLRMQAQTILLATGASDIVPPFPEITHAIAKGLIRQCPICDAYEVIKQKIAVIGHDDHAALEALFLRTYSPNITLITLGSSGNLSPEISNKLSQANISLITEPIESVYYPDYKMSVLTTKSGHAHSFDTIYPALGQVMCSQLAVDAGAKISDKGCLIVDAHQCTTVPGLYAAGDVVSGLSQICVAMGQAAIAATAIHNSLEENLWN